METLTKRVDPTASLTFSSTEELIQKIHEEYRKEFAFEGKRFFQIKRWIWDNPVILGYAFKCPIERTDCNSTICKVENPSYMFAFPIPTAELNANSNLKQNQGY